MEERATHRNRQPKHQEGVPSQPDLNTPSMPSAGKPLWELGINELAGRNLETAGRNEVNEMLKQGWVLLHIYTLRYPERESPRGPRVVWRERPMAILGRRTT